MASLNSACGSAHGAASQEHIPALDLAQAQLVVAMMSCLQFPRHVAMQVHVTPGNIFFLLAGSVGELTFFKVPRLVQPSEAVDTLEPRSSTSSPARSASYATPQLSPQASGSSGVRSVPSPHMMRG